MEKEPKVVVIGGGTGLSVLLRGLKKFPLNISAIVTVADDGGSTGKLRDMFEIPAPGDIRNVMVSLSEVEPLIEKLLQYRFKIGNLDGHAMGNLLLTAVADITGNMVDGIEALSKILNVKGRILPLTNESITLCAQFADGSVVEGESTLTKVDKKINKVFYKEKVTAYNETLKVVREADYIIFSIGSLYTSIIPNLLIDEMREAISTSKAKKIYICNAMEQPGETVGYRVSDHIKAINNHCQKSMIDYVIVNDEKIPDDVYEKYMKQGVKPVKIDEKNIEKLGVQLSKHRIISITESREVRHNPIRLASVVYSKILDWEYDK
ncbi:MAG: YvcK family protein [Fusobacteriaceae bacterium]|nr:YvcK family protein [Fusobacteriaceae bacterium]MBN2837959.1 YvcK family protein [Fusobacteriaceae bacterium]